MMQSIIIWLQTVAIPLLIAHITLGFVSLSVALAIGVVSALPSDSSHSTAQRQGARMKTVWTVFAIGMVGVGMSGLILAMITSDRFLFSIAVFVLYMNVQVLYALNSAAITRANRVVMAVALLFGVGMVARGVVSIINQQSVAATLILFGALLCFLVVRDWRTAHNATAVSRIVSNGVGSVIAALTAFLVVNVDIGELQWIVWIAPTIAITPIISMVIRVYERSRRQADSYHHPLLVRIVARCNALERALSNRT